MRKTAGKTGFSGRAKERHGSDRSPREGPSERLPSGMTAEEPFLLIDKMPCWKSGCPATEECGNTETCQRMSGTSSGRIVIRMRISADISAAITGNRFLRTNAESPVSRRGHSLPGIDYERRAACRGIVRNGQKDVCQNRQELWGPGENPEDMDPVCPVA